LPPSQSNKARTLKLLASVQHIMDSYDCFDAGTGIDA